MRKKIVSFELKKFGGKNKMTFFNEVGSVAKDVGKVTIIIVIVGILLSKLQEIDSIPTAINNSITTLLTTINEPFEWVSLIFVLVIISAVYRKFAGSGKKGGIM